jgi:hypothetical protein
MKKILSFSQQLQDEFNRRKELDASLSFRAFAKWIGVSAGTLLQVARSQRPASIEIIDAVCKKLELSPLQTFEWKFGAEMNSEKNYYILTEAENKFLEKLECRIVWSAFADKKGEDRILEMCKAWDLDRDYFKPTLKQMVAQGFLVEQAGKLQKFDSKATLIYPLSNRNHSLSPVLDEIRNLSEQNEAESINMGQVFLLAPEEQNKLRSQIVSFLEKLKNQARRPDTAVPWAIRVLGHPLTPLKKRS